MASAHDLPPCATGRQLVQHVNAALEDPRRPHFGSFMASTEEETARARDAVNSPGSVRGVEIPLWPFSEQPKYCQGSPQWMAAQRIITDLYDVTQAEVDNRAEVRQEAVAATFRGWWDSITGVVKLVLVAVALLGIAYVWRAFR